MRLRRVLALVGVASLAISAAPALAFTTLANETNRRSLLPSLRTWGPVWAGFTLPLLAWSVAAGDGRTAGNVLLQGAVGLFAGVFMRVRRRTALVGLSVGICLLAAASTVGAAYSSRSFTAYAGSGVLFRFGVHGPYQRIIGGATSEPAARRSWLLDGDAGLTLEGRMRLAPVNESPSAVSGESTARTEGPEPQEVLVTLDWPGRTEPARVRVDAGPNWEPFQIQVEGPVKAPFVIARVDVPAGATVDVAAVGLKAPDGRPPQAPPPTRQSLHLGDPVILAHSAFALATAVVAARPGLATTVIALGATGIVGWTTGTRAVFAALVALVLVRPLGRRFRSKLAVVTLASVVLIGGALLVQRSRQADLDGAMPRSAVWYAAIEAFMENPLTGLRGEGTTFSSVTAATGSPVTHAHNFWLEYASQYGIFGAVSAVLLTGGLVLLALRRAGAYGAALLAPIYLLSFVDVTLLNGQVLVCVVLAVNSLEIQISPLGTTGGRAISSAQ